MSDDKQAQERLIEAAVALLEGAPGRRMQITNLNKALFYLDLVALRDTGATITGNTYLALPRGPAMHGYKENLVGELERRHLARQDNNGYDMPVVLTGAIDSYHHLDDYWRQRAAQLAGRVAGMTAAQISQHSHDHNPGWQIAHAKQNNSKKKTAPQPINMVIALQELGDRDPWLGEAPSEDLLRLANNIDALEGEPW